MKAMYSPSEFVAEVERQAQAAQDIVTPTEAIRFHTNEQGVTRFAVEGVEGDYGVKDTAHAQIASRLQIPLPYYRRMQEAQPALLDANVGTWLNAKSERRLVRTMDGDVRAFLSDRYQRIDNLRILQTIAPILEQLQLEHGASIQSAALTDTKMYVKVVVTGIEGLLPPQPGRGQGHDFQDVVWPGFCIKNSETGHGAFSVEQMIIRRVCSNGMIVGETLSRRHLGARIQDDAVFSDRTRRLDDETILSAAHDIVSAAVDETKFATLVAAFGEAHQTAPTVDPVKTVEVLAKSHSLSETEQAHVLRAFTMDASMNGYGLFGLVNAVTRASQDVEDYDRATEMEAMGGELLLNTSDRDWLRLAGVAA